jgi:hypothetical protein
VLITREYFCQNLGNKPDFPFSDCQDKYLGDISGLLEEPTEERDEKLSLKYLDV